MSFRVFPPFLRGYVGPYGAGSLKEDGKMLGRKAEVMLLTFPPSRLQNKQRKRLEKDSHFTNKERTVAKPMSSGLSNQFSKLNLSDKHLMDLAFLKKKTWSHDRR